MEGSDATDKARPRRPARPATVASRPGRRSRACLGEAGVRHRLVSPRTAAGCGLHRSSRTPPTPSSLPLAITSGSCSPGSASFCAPGWQSLALPVRPQPASTRPLEKEFFTDDLLAPRAPNIALTPDPTVRFLISSLAREDRPHILQHIGVRPRRRQSQHRASRLCFTCLGLGDVFQPDHPAVEGFSVPDIFGRSGEPVNRCRPRPTIRIHAGGELAHARLQRCGWGNSGDFSARADQGSRGCHASKVSR